MALVRGGGGCGVSLFLALVGLSRKVLFVWLEKEGFRVFWLVL